MKFKTKQNLSEILRDQFDSVVWSSEHIYSNAQTIIETCVDLRFIKLATDMVVDAKEYGYDYTNLLN